MKPVNVGIVGCGAIGPSHIEAGQASEGVNIQAVADIDEEKARKTAEEFQIPEHYTDAQKIFDHPDIEGVVLALPTGFRGELAIRALDAGKNVLLEKPAAMNCEELEEIKKAAGDLVVASCSARYRFLKTSDLVTEFIAEGNLGDLRILRCRGLIPAGPPPEKEPPPWRVNKELNGGGILVNWGCYDLDYLLGLCGWELRPEWVLAQNWPVPPQFKSHIAPGSDAEEHSSAMIKCTGGTVVMFERGEKLPMQQETAWQITGTKGTVHLSMNSDEKKILFDNTSTEEGVFREVLWEGKEDMTPVHAQPIVNFAQAIRGESDPKTGLEEAMVLQKITDAIYESSEGGRPVQLS
ncbi:MAG: Gfo/Idh/MocA family protein [Planctomycetota bacterium]